MGAGETPESKVAFLLKHVAHYQIPFFESLRSQLRMVGIELAFVHGQPMGVDKDKQDAGELPWAITIRNRRIGMGDQLLLWQPALGLLRDQDLIIVEDASRLLINYRLLGRQARGGPRVALWGHGMNRQSSRASRISEWVKRLTTARAHWYFAYTAGTAQVLSERGFPPERISVINNTLDVEALTHVAASVPETDLDQMRTLRGISRDAPVGVFCGSLYKAKRIAFLLDAALVTRRIVPAFELIVIGTGPEKGLINEFASRFPWIHWEGAQHDVEKVKRLLLADVMLMPAAVGLAAVDSLALGIPLVALEDAAHGPEIEYIRSGANGLIIDDTDSPETYGRAIADLLLDRERLSQLQIGCRNDAAGLSMKAMVDRFTQGVSAALEMPPP